MGVQPHARLRVERRTRPSVRAKRPTTKAQARTTLAPPTKGIESFDVFGGSNGQGESECHRLANSGKSRVRPSPMPHLFHRRLYTMPVRVGGDGSSVREETLMEDSGIRPRLSRTRVCRGHSLHTHSLHFHSRTEDAE